MHVPRLPRVISDYECSKWTSKPGNGNSTWSRIFLIGGRMTFSSTVFSVTSHTAWLVLIVWHECESSSTWSSWNAAEKSLPSSPHGSTDAWTRAPLQMSERGRSAAGVLRAHASSFRCGVCICAAAILHLPTAGHEIASWSPAYTTDTF